MSENNVRYSSQGREKKRRVFFTGATALKLGVAVCYDYANGANAVAVPTTSLKKFAGVTCNAYAAQTGGRWIDIYEPGSVCYVLGDETVAAGDFLVASYNTTGTIGTFRDKNASGVTGKGVATAIEAVTINTTTGNLVIKAVLEEGVESGCTAN
jgi:hypothetical protein